MEEVKALAEEPCTGLKSREGWLGSLGPTAAAAEKALECPTRTGQGRLITQRAGPVVFRSHQPSSHCQCLLPVVVFCSEHQKLSWLQ